MTPLDHLRFWLASLDEDLQHEIAFALVPALVDDPNGRCFRSERDFGIKDLSEWLAPTRFALRGIGKVTSAAAMIDYVFGEAPSQESKIIWERIKEGWQALKRERIGPDALTAWAGAALAEKLKALGMPDPGGPTAIWH
jgi:hypothetical protein